MALHREAKPPKELIVLIRVISASVVLAAAVALAGRNQVQSNPELTAFGMRTSDGAQGLGLGAAALQYTVFTSETGDYSFEAPSSWAHPLKPRDPTREAFFVGPVDRTRHTGVFLTVSRYPRGGTSASIEVLIAQLLLDRTKQIVSNEALVIDQRPARLLTIQEHAAVPGWSPGIVHLALSESLLIIEDEQEIYMLEYVSSPELHREYLPVFDRLVTSFRFHHETPSQ